MRTYVSTLGYHETRVTRPVISNGIDSEDRIVLIRPSTSGVNDRAKEAVSYVKDMIGEIAPEAVVTTEEIDTTTFITAVLQSSDILQAVDRDRELLVNFGGGAREVLLPFLLAAVLHAPRINTAFQYTDVEQEVREVTVPALTTQLPRSTVETFTLVATRDTAVELPTLAKESNQSKSTVSRHIDALAAAGVVETWLADTTKQVAVSDTGRLLDRAGVASKLRDR